MNEHMPWELLARYFAEEIAQEEKLQMESWINAQPEREQTVEELREVWEQSGRPACRLDPEQAWKRLAEDMDKLEDEARHWDQLLRAPKLSRNGSQGQPNRSKGRVRTLMITAAAAAVIFAAAIFAYGTYQSTASSPEIAKRELTAGEGERASYVLNDGSRVVLHAGSRLQVPLSFSRGNRELFLEGEAYFEVAHDDSSPFVVHSEHAFTRVLGTKFLVRAWPDERHHVEVIVSEGKVALGRESDGQAGEATEAIITKNKKGSITEERAPEVADVGDLHWYLGWTEGKLTFKNRSMREIIPKLEQWYAIEIQTGSERIANKRLTAEIDYSQPMGEVLKGIALSLDLRMERHGRIVLFASREQ